MENTENKTGCGCKNNCDCDCNENSDTILLLKECDAGSKMAVSSIDDVLDSVDDPALRSLLVESREHHEKLGNDIHSLLITYHSDEKDPNPMAKGMSWLKTNWKLAMNDDGATIADLLTDGCHMGIKSLHKYLNEYPTADPKAIDLCNKLIAIEEKLCSDLEKYL